MTGEGHYLTEDVAIVGRAERRGWSDRRRINSPVPGPYGLELCRDVDAALMLQRGRRGPGPHRRQMMASQNSIPGRRLTYRTLWVVHRHRRIDDNPGQGMRSRVFNHHFQRREADICYRYSTLWTPAGDIAWSLGIQSAGRSFAHRPECHL